jgi:putative membrane protein
MWFAHEGMGWWMIFGGIWMVVFWGAIIALIIWGIKKLTERSNSGEDAAGKSSPLDVVKERYARGEISKEEFERMKKDLS